MTDTEAGRLYYLVDYTDEVIPCAPKLEAWAKWLSEPDENFEGHEPADGAVFAYFTLDVLGDVRVDLIDGTWRPASPVPEGTDTYFLRWHEGASGWDAEHGGDTIADALDGLEDEASCWLACIKSSGDGHVRWNAATRALEIVEGHA
jgi:hypothetical protein